MARRSPSARLYSGVPRSSQWPSIVTYQVEYFFSAEALALRTAWPSALTSLLSSSKNTGLRGELRLRSSSEADAMVSSLTGSGGTMMGSATGSGGAGGRTAGGATAAVVVDGGGAGRATGAFLPPQAAATTATRIRTHSAARKAADRVDIVCSILWAMGPVGLIIVAGLRHLLQILPVARDREHLRFSRPGRHERQVPPVRRPRWA